MSHVPSVLELQLFQHYVQQWYERYGRHHLPWRQTTDPYRILVSELMLQQTQVERVLPKFLEFVERFPTVHALAAAELAEVLQHWQGLGYNRRAQHLHRTAQVVVQTSNGVFPETLLELQNLPGIGPYTSGAIMAFAFNRPVTLIETNIRSVFLYHFFHDREKVNDQEILPLIQSALPAKNIRGWYAALMDYGSHLKRVLPNPSRKSIHHARQSTFAGSNRQIRGAILRVLTLESPGSSPKRALSKAVLQELVETDLGRSIDTHLFTQILDKMLREKLVNDSNATTDSYSL